MSDLESDKIDEAQLPFGKKSKHTLDSDEEDDEVDADKYRMDQIEGTEKATIDFDGDIKITPFNMDEELETGHFDQEGTYIFKKEDDIRDNWLDNIDWARVKPNTDSSKDQSEENDQDDEEVSRTNKEELYKQIIELVRPGETVQRAIQRFGRDCPKTRKGQKRKIDAESSVDTKATVAKENIMKLTSIADQFLQTGDMDIYDRTYEELQLHLKNITNQNKEPSGSDDMFSDDFDANAKPSTSVEANSTPSISSVSWQFKWEDNEEAPVYGPYPSESMQAWVDNGHFKDGVFVRRTDSEDAKFYSSKRIDFELYI